MKRTLFLLLILFFVNAQSSIVQLSFYDDASDVILGKWTCSVANKPFILVVQKIKGNKTSGYFSYDNKKIELDGIIGRSAWDQPCSKAYGVTFKEKNNPDSENTLVVKFVGYQGMDGGEGGVDCMGKLHPGEVSGTWLRLCCSDEDLSLKHSSE